MPKTWVEPEGELRSFKNRGARAPRAQKRGVKIFKILNFEK